MNEKPNKIHFNEDLIKERPEEATEGFEMLPIKNEAKSLEQKQEEEKKEEYHFKEMTEIKSAMISLVEQLKESIGKGEYGALLSDDAGGRIPTLILCKIFKEKSPEKIKTYFLSAGIDIHHINESYNKNSEKYKKIIKYLEKIDFGDKKALIITQFSSTGKSLESIGQLLKSIGVDRFDFVSLYKDSNSPSKEQLMMEFKEEFNSKIFFSQCEKIPKWIIGDHEQVSGVRKSFSDGPLVEKIGRQENIKKSREDFKLMAKIIIKKVWSEKNNE